MPRSLKPALAGATLALAACWHATVDTGLTPSTQVVEKNWASAWIIGLVPPSTLETQAKCPNGVAKVETKLSFLNQLVEILTLDIYTPMSIKVTCAQGGRASIAPGAQEIQIPANLSSQEVRALLRHAAEVSALLAGPVYLEF